jgi:phage terminase large subunit
MSYVPKIKLTRKQYQGISLLNDEFTQYLLWGGGANGGKSFLGCIWLIYMCYVYPKTKYFIGREELKRLRESTLLTFFKVLQYYKIPSTDFHYNGQDHYIEHNNGSRIDLLDLKYLPSDPLYERYGSTEYTSGWIEEAGEVHHGAYDVLKSRVGRHMNDFYGLMGKMFLTCNPKKNWLYQNFYKPHRNNTLTKDKAFIQSLVTDNDFRESGSLDKLEAITNKAQRERLRYGNWDYEDEPDQLIFYEWLDKAQDNKIIPGKNCLGCDVARFGDDSSVIVKIHGNSVNDIMRFREMPTDKFADEIIKYSTREKISADKIGVDVVGLGAGTVDVLQRLNWRVNAINSGASPINNESDEYIYNNLRSQMWWICREELRKNELNINLSNQELKEELFEDLTAPKYDVSGDKFLKIESKKDIKARIGRSPDLGDAFVYANWMRKVRDTSGVWF